MTMRHIQFFAGFLVAAAMMLLLVYEVETFLKWIMAGVGFAALAFMLITYLSALSKASKEKREHRDKYMPPKPKS